MVGERRAVANLVTIKSADVLPAGSKISFAQSGMEIPANSVGRDFDRMLALVVRLATLSLTGLIYAATALRYASPSTNIYKLVLFVVVATIIPLAAALANRFLGQETHETGNVPFQSCEMIVLAAAVSFVCAALLMHLLRVDISVWSEIVRWLLLGLTVVHFAFLATMGIAPRKLRAEILATWQRIITIKGMIPTPVTFVLVVLASLLFVFRVESNNALLNVAFGGVFNLSPKPGWGVLLTAPIAAALILLAGFRLVRFEAKYQIARPIVLRRMQRIVLASSVLGIFLWYFDFMFRSDVLHFLANVGPASQIIHAGSVPLVTAFSQYGLGPLLATWLTFLIASPSFQAANVIAQLHSLTFYAVIMICLFGMTRHRLAALLFGFAAIGVVLAGWGGGNSSLNTVPSSIGMRYLPNALLVLAISFLDKDRAVSPAVFASMLLSAVWSYETLFGSVAILGLLLLILALRNRSAGSSIRQALVGLVLPTALSVALMSAITVAWSGQLPNYRAYLTFMLAYNPMSDFWSLPGNGSFLGWIAIAVAGMTAMALAWSSAIAPRIPGLPRDSDLLIYRFAPMAGLVAFMSSYFAGRSVDFTLIISFLPMAALVIPAIVMVFRLAMLGHRPARYLVPVACVSVFLPLTFSIAALYRGGSPYAVTLQQCLYERACSPSRLVNLIRTRYPLRPMIDQRADPNYFDQSGLTTEAIELIDKFAADRKQIALFLGIHPTTIWSVHTNAVLVLASKGHRWPISYVLSDEINPILRYSVIDAEVKLKEGEIIFIRKDESRLGELEGAIVKKIRTEVRLCPLPTNGEMVSAYRATRLSTC